MKDRSPKSISRRSFLKTSAAVPTSIALGLAVLEAVEASHQILDSCGFPTGDSHEKRNMTHFCNVSYPGNYGQKVEDIYDDYPLRSLTVYDGADYSPGSFSACAVNLLYDSYYGFESSGGVSGLSATLDAEVIENFDAISFRRASFKEQIRAVHESRDDFFGLVAPAFRGAHQLTQAAALGAAHNYSVTNDIGWPGPNGGYFAQGIHPLSRWRQPVRRTSNGNLP